MKQITKNEDWVRTPLKRYLHVQSGEMISANEETAEGFPIIGGNGLRGYTNRFNRKGPSLVIGRVGSKCGCVHLIENNFWASEHAFVVFQRKPFHLVFGKYLLEHLDLNKQAIRTAQPLINTEIVEETIGFFPPLPTQHRIATYLDRETTQIDALIAAKERLLLLLAEKRQALITRAVTRGLDPAVKMKDSGVEWLGEVPEHWEVVRLASIFKERDTRCEPELPLLEVSINSGVIIREFSKDSIESVASDFNIYKVARPGDVVFNKMRMWQGAVGIAPTDGLVSPDYTVAYSDDSILADFANILFRTKQFSAECARHSHGIVWDRLRLYWEGFREINIALPSRKEQQEIVSFIRQKVGLMDSLIVITNQSITLLKERRSALISAAVTGQLTIPD